MIEIAGVLEGVTPKMRGSAKIVELKITASLAAVDLSHLAAMFGESVSLEMETSQMTFDFKRERDAS